MKLVEEIVARADEHTLWRRDIHAHPELAYEENRTADLVAEKLESFGIPIVRGLGKTGVVGTIKAGKSDRSIGLRADMDALPLQEMNAFDHRSQHEGVMHGCGHDGHTTMLLAAAEYLAKHQDFDGIVHFIFQPAEEGEAGAKAMMRLMGRPVGQQRPPAEPLDEQEMAELRDLVVGFGWPLSERAPAAAAAATCSFIFSANVFTAALSSFPSSPLGPLPPETNR